MATRHRPSKGVGAQLGKFYKVISNGFIEGAEAKAWKISELACEAADKAEIGWAGYVARNFIDVGAAPDFEVSLHWEALDRLYRLRKRREGASENFFEYSGTLKSDFEKMPGEAVLESFGNTKPRLEESRYMRETALVEAMRAKRKLGSVEGFTLRLAPFSNVSNSYLQNPKTSTSFDANVGLAALIEDKLSNGVNKLMNPGGEFRPMLGPSLILYIRDYITDAVNTALNQNGFNVKGTK